MDLIIHNNVLIGLAIDSLNHHNQVLELQVIQYILV